MWYSRSDRHLNGGALEIKAAFVGYKKTMTRRLTAIFLLSISLAASCSGRGHRTVPVPQEIVFSGDETMVLTPVVLPEELESHEAAARELDSLVAVLLRDRGYTLVPAEQYSAIWGGIVEQMGGLFDPETGVRDDEKFALARERLFLDLGEIYQADAILYPEVWVVDAPFSDGVATWDGVSESLVGFGVKLLAALSAIFTDESDTPLPVGSVRAISLVVFAEAMNGDEVFSNSGGIQVLEKVGTDPSDIEAVRDKDILADPDRNRHAVEIALGPLLKRN